MEAKQRDPPPSSGAGTCRPLPAREPGPPPFRGSLPAAAAWLQETSWGDPQKRDIWVWGSGERGGVSEAPRHGSRNER